jgi:hypothetical protein
VTRSLEPGLEGGFVGEFGNDHRLCGDHSPPFLLDLAGPQRPEQQPRSADPDVPDTCFRVLPILRIHGLKVTVAMASREAANGIAGRPHLTAFRDLQRALPSPHAS